MRKDDLILLIKILNRIKNPPVEAQYLKITAERELSQYELAAHRCRRQHDSKQRTVKGVNNKSNDRSSEEESKQPEQLGV